MDELACSLQKLFLSICYEQDGMDVCASRDDNLGRAMLKLESNWVLLLKKIMIMTACVLTAKCQLHFSSLPHVFVINYSIVCLSVCLCLSLCTNHTDKNYENVANLDIQLVNFMWQ